MGAADGIGVSNLEAEVSLTIPGQTVVLLKLVGQLQNADRRSLLLRWIQPS